MSQVPVDPEIWPTEDPADVEGQWLRLPPEQGEVLPLIRTYPTYDRHLLG